MVGELGQKGKPYSFYTEDPTKSLMEANKSIDNHSTQWVVSELEPKGKMCSFVSDTKNHVLRLMGANVII